MALEPSGEPTVPHRFMQHQHRQLIFALPGELFDVHTSVNGA
jgi:hypothetical protein